VRSDVYPTRGSSDLGEGRTEIMESIFGFEKQDNGTVKLEGNKLNIRHPNDEIKAGIGFITEDRKMKGLMIEASIRENISLTNMKNISKHGVISTAKEKPLVKQLIERLNVKSTNKEQTVKSLS